MSDLVRRRALAPLIAGVMLVSLVSCASGGRDVWAKNESTTDAIFAVVDTSGNVIDAYSLPAGASGVARASHRFVDRVIEFVIYDPACGAPRKPVDRGSPVTPGPIRVLIDAAGAVWVEIAEEPPGIGDLAKSAACAGHSGASH
jgi:hypothetical protein